MAMVSRIRVMASRIRLAAVEVDVVLGWAWFGHGRAAGSGIARIARDAPAFPASIPQSNPLLNLEKRAGNKAAKTIPTRLGDQSISEDIWLTACLTRSKYLELCQK